ncbi:Putative deoxyribonuclease YjjV [hydrothermal vent metagenome]|uniref:Deoxyribonuclease YjjV n=1 Tax=hydrothermal vent metagenome TaxID=652676 RepID=A0A3B1BH79_9ZZZZ
MSIFDTHCHLDSPKFDPDRNRVLENCRKNGIEHILVPAVERAGWDGLLALCSQDKFLYPALGLHPIFIKKHRQADLKRLENYVAEYTPVSIGEIGLDFYIEKPDRDRQVEFFSAQLSIAANAKLPVVLHIRKAHDQVLSLLRKHTLYGGFVHAFNGSLQQAQQFIDLGFKLGFGGTLTYKGSKKIRALAQVLPLEAIVLETDAPDMPNVKHRGERNSPEYIVDCLNVLAELRGEDSEYIAEHTCRNAFAVLGIRERAFLK